MGSSTDGARRGRRTGGALLAAVLATGCLSGHLLDAARRRDVPVAVRAAALRDDQLTLVLDAETRTDFDRPRGRTALRARVRLRDLARGGPIDALPIRFERACGALSGTPVPVRPAAAGPAALPVLVMEPGEPAAARLVTPARAYPPLYLDALIRTHYAPWVWIVMPVALAADAAIVPPLLLFTPAVVTIGD